MLNKIFVTRHTWPITMTHVRENGQSPDTIDRSRSPTSRGVMKPFWYLNENTCLLFFKK